MAINKNILLEMLIQFNLMPSRYLVLMASSFVTYLHFDVYCTGERTKLNDFYCFVSPFYMKTVLTVKGSNKSVIYTYSNANHNYEPVVPLLHKIEILVVFLVILSWLYTGYFPF